MVMTSVYLQVYNSVNSMNMADPNARLLRRLIFANAYPVETDKVWLILVLEHLRMFANLNGEAIVAGQGDYFEIRTPAALEINR